MQLEWWERWGRVMAALAARCPRAVMWASHTRVALTWLAIPTLLVLVVLSPAARSAVGVVVSALFVLGLWFLLARSVTVSWTALVRTMTLLLGWSVLIAATSSWVSRGIVGIEVTSNSATIVVASLVEETLKLAPIALLAVLAPGRFRRLGASDIAMLGVASGVAFNIVEESVRPTVTRGLLAPEPGWCTPAWMLGCTDSPWRDFGQLHGVLSESEFAGHAVATGLVAALIGLTMQVGRLLAKPSSNFAHLVGLAMVVAVWLGQVATHGRNNAGLFGDGWEHMPWVVRIAADAAVAAPDAHSTLVVLLLLAVVLDAAVQVRVRDADPYEPRREGHLSMGWRRVREVLGTLPVWLGRILDAVLAAVVMVVRDIGDLLRALTGSNQFGDGVAEARTLLSMQRTAREVGQGHEYDTTGGRRMTRVLGLGGLGVCLLLVLVLTPALTSDVAVPLGEKMPFGGGWLAGILDALGTWWQVQPMHVKVGALLLVGAAVMLSGGTVGTAFLGGGWAGFVLGNGTTLADLVRDPRGTARSYLATRTAGDVAADGALLILETALGGVLGKAGGLLARRGRGTAVELRHLYREDPTAFAALMRSERGSIRWDSLPPGASRYYCADPKTHPLYGTTGDGPGTWTEVDDYMKEASARFQNQVTGVPVNVGYVVDDVKFDTFQDGVLIEVKDKYAQFFDDQLQPLHWFENTGWADLKQQIYRQLEVAGGHPVEWHVSEEKFARALAEHIDILRLEGITIKHVPGG